ncbi:MAG: copper chaperone PCu(A)C [Casimicrobiaceae bacterium]
MGPILLVGMLMFSGLAAAHDYRLGALRIDHPYALPTAPGVSTGAAYLRTIRNTGDTADRLVGASTPIATRVEIYQKITDEAGVMRMRAVPALELAARSEQRLRHDGAYHLMLIGLERPLKDGDRFPLTLRFERAGEREVTVWVQMPRRSGSPQEHRH